MGSRDVGLLAVAIAGGLAIGWAGGADIVMPSPSEAAPTTGLTPSAAAVQHGSGLAPGATALPPPPNRTSEGEQLDAAVRAGAPAAFQSGMAENQPAAEMPEAAPLSTATGPAPPASGGSWGGQGQSSGGGWGVQAGVAPAGPGPTPAPAQPASPSAAADQQPSG